MGIYEKVNTPWNRGAVGAFSCFTNTSLLIMKYFFISRRKLRRSPSKQLSSHPQHWETTFAEQGTHPFLQFVVISPKTVVCNVCLFLLLKTFLEFFFRCEVLLWELYVLVLGIWVEGARKTTASTTAATATTSMTATKTPVVVTLVCSLRLLFVREVFVVAICVVAC